MRALVVILNAVRRQVLSGCGLLATAWMCVPLAADGVAHARMTTVSGQDPQRGVFLVARRSMPDPHFRKTVVLLFRHDDKGTLGVILNHAIGVNLDEAVPDLQVQGAEQHKVYWGGPVAQQAMLFLFRNDAPREQAQHVMQDVYLSATRDVLVKLFEEGITSSRLRLFTGHSGWAPRQLDAEISRGDWFVMRANARDVFRREPNGLWRELIDIVDPPGLLVRERGGRSPGAAIPRVMSFRLL
jgi:putative transcriptional regulator